MKNIKNYSKGFPLKFDNKIEYHHRFIKPKK